MVVNKSYQMDEVKEKGWVASEEDASTNINVGKRKVYIKRTVLLIIWIAVFEAIGACIGIFFGAGDWYDTINKPSVTPPGVVFSIVWPILYCMLAVFGWWLSYGLQHTQIKYVFTIFCVQMVGNWVWSPVFQYLHETVAGLVIISILIALNAYIFIRMLTLNIRILSVSTRYIAFIILPYLAWCCFATYLNAYIVANNP